MSGPRIRDKRDRLRQLRAFCEALRRGSISRAAEHLGLTQPAVSLNVRDLEHELGEALLVRTTAGVEPTPAGERLHALADPLVRDADSLLSDFARHLDLAPPDGVRVASSNAGAAFVLPAYLKRFRDAHPDIAVRLDAATVPEGFKRLADDEVDFVVGPRERFDEERIVYRELRTYRIVLITAPDHPLAGRASVSPREAAAHPADGAEMAPALDPRDPLRRLAAGVMRLARLSADAGSGAARHGGRLSLPRPALRVRIGAKGVVTGAKIGLRASGGKDRDKNFPSEALVTGWYGAATTELPPAAWSAEADVGAERRNQVPLSRSIAMSRGQTPRPRHDGPLLTGGGLAQPKRRGGCRADSCGHAATGEPPGIDEASEPRRVALQAGPGAFTSSGRADEPQRWHTHRAETVLAATVGQPTRPSRRIGRQA